ncbi:spore germination protein, partial [Bacillus altitudinis]|uniref:spore germination protein n=1 Tax=Bacillus altitudinis TaxID=293387 RepID=UPI00119EE3F6
VTTYPRTIPQQPHTQNVRTPARHGFVQNIILNTPLIPTTLPDQKLPYKILKLPDPSKPHVSVSYIQHIPDPHLLH